MESSSVGIKNAFFLVSELVSFLFGDPFKFKIVGVRGLTEEALVSSFKRTPCKISLGHL